MQIPVGQFGYGAVKPATGSPGKVNVPAEAFVTADDFVKTAGVAVQIASQDLQNEKNLELRRQVEADRERKVNEEQARRNGMASTFAQYQVDLNALTTDVETKLTEGQIKREDADKTFTDGIAGLRKKHIDALDPRSQAELGDNLIRFDGMASQRFQETLRKNARQERASTFTTTVESFERLAVSDRAGALKQAQVLFDTEGAALMGKDVSTKQFQAFRERVAVTDYSNQILQNKGSIKGLQTLETSIQADPDLDPDKKTVLVGRTMSMRETLLAKAQRAEESRLNTVQRQIDAADKLILSGFEPSADQMLALQRAAKGTPYEPVVAAQIKFANQTAAFRAADPRAQETFVNQFEAQVRKNPTPDGVKTLDGYRSILNSTREQVKTDPMSFAARRGLADVQPLDLAKPETLGDQIAARLDIAGGMRSKYGAPLQVLTREEGAQLSQFLRDATVDQKRQYLGALAGAVKNREAFATMMQQIAPDSPVTAVAGLYAARGTQGGNAAVVADKILRGQEALNPSKKEDGRPVKAVLPMPPERDLLTAFNAYERDAFAGRKDARNAYLQTAQAIYAAKSLEAGDFTGNLNSKRWDESMQMATGGIEKYKGRAVVLPYGYDYSKFKDEVRDRVAAVVSSKALDETATLSRLRDMPLENVGDGRYMLRAGDGVLVDKQGNQVVLDFNEPLARSERPATRKTGAPLKFDQNAAGAATGTYR